MYGNNLGLSTTFLREVAMAAILLARFGACARTPDLPGQPGYPSSWEEGILTYCNPSYPHCAGQSPSRSRVWPLRSDACALALTVWRRLLRHGYED